MTQLMRVSLRIFNESPKMILIIFLEQEIRKYQVSLNNFKFIRMIGRGYVGRVWLARKLDGVDKGQLYAIKSLKKIDRNKNKVANIKNERNVSIFLALLG